jgi:hypothetical protein
LTNGYATICSTVWERNMFPRVACSGLMVGNVTDWLQSMSGFSGVAYPSLRMVGGIITVWYQSTRFNTELGWTRRVQLK